MRELYWKKKQTTAFVSAEIKLNLSSTMFSWSCMCCTCVVNLNPCNCPQCEKKKNVSMILNLVKTFRIFNGYILTTGVNSFV